MGESNEESTPKALSDNYRVTSCFIEENKYILFDENGSHYVCTSTNSIDINQGDVIECDLTKNNENYTIEKYNVSHSTETFFNFLQDIDKESLSCNELWFYVGEKEGYTIEQLWTNFLDNIANNRTCSLYIIDENSGNLISSFVFYHNGSFFCCRRLYGCLGKR